MELRIYRAIEANPGIGAKQLREMLPGRNIEKDGALKDLLKTGAVEDRGSGQARSYHIRLEAGQGWARSGQGFGQPNPESGGARVGQGSGQPEPEPAKSLRATDGQGLGNTLGTPGCPTPLVSGVGRNAPRGEFWGKVGNNWN